jgi:hypothetical protein
MQPNKVNKYRQYNRIETHFVYGEFIFSTIVQGFERNSEPNGYQESRPVAYATCHGRTATENYH